MPLPQIVTSQTDFSAGEIDSTIVRSDDSPIEKAGLRRCLNFRILDTKGLSNRFGRSVQFIDGPRVDEVLMSPGNVFRLVFGNGNLSVRNAVGAVVFTTALKGDGVTAIPWTTATARAVVWGVYQLSIYIAYADGAPNNVPQILTWDGVSQSSTWTLATFTELIITSQKRTPFFRLSPQGITLVPSATTGAGVTLTASSAVFVAGHVGTRLRWVGRQLLITGFTNSTTVTATVEEPLNSTVRIATSGGIDPRTQYSVGDVVVGATTGGKGIVVATTATTADIVMLTGQQFFITGNEDIVGPAGTVHAIGASQVTISPAAVTVWDDEVMNSFRGFPSSLFIDQGRLGFCNFPSVPAGIGWSAFGVLNDFYVPPFGVTPAASIFEIAPGKSQVFYVTPGMESSEFVFCDNAVYGIPINVANPLSGVTGVAFQNISSTGAARVQPRAVANVVLYINAGASSVRAIVTTGAFNRANESRDITDLHNHLINSPIAIAAPTDDASYPEDYVYVLNGDGTAIVGKFEVSNGDIKSGTTPGWTQMSGNGFINWISARAANVMFNVTYPTGPVTVAELLDPAQYMDAALFYNSIPAAMPPPLGKGPLWWFVNGSVTVMDLGTRQMGTYQVDANGFLVPQFIGGENLASSQLVAGQAWSGIIEPFIPSPGPGQDAKQRMIMRRIARFSVYVQQSTGFVMQKLFSGPLRPNGPALGDVVNSRRVPTYNQDDDATKPPPLRETQERWRPSGRSFNPRVNILNDTPGPLIVIEIATEVSV